MASLSGATTGGIGPWGLITALPATYFVSLALLGVSFVLNLLGRRFSVRLAVVQAVFLTVLLQTAPQVIEPLPRFATAWLHAGFTDYIAHTGRAAVHVDARFSWPSFFAGSAVLSKTAGVPSATYLLRWWPVCIDLLYLLPLWAIASRLLPTRRHAGLVLFLFPLAYWVGQDYYSPQSIGFLLYMSFVAIVLSAFPGSVGAGEPFGLAWLDPEATDRATVLRRLAMLIGLLLLCLAMSTGHQLTPIVAGLSLTGLVLFRRTSLRAFAPLVLLITIGWVCYGAIAFWSGHSTQVFGGLGHLFSNINRDLFARVAGSSPAHRHVGAIRSGLTAAFWLTAAGGFFLSQRARVDRWAPAILSLAAAPIIAGQSYGGEGLVRVYLMSLPGVLVLTSVVLMRRQVWVRAALIAGGLISLIPGFLVARWGNEIYEQVKPAEIAAIRWIYRTAPAHSEMVALNGQVPWQFADVTKYHYAVATNKANQENFSAVTQAFTHYSLGYVIVTEGQIQYGIQRYGEKPAWAVKLGRQMVSSGMFRLVYHNPDAWVYLYDRSGATGGA